MKNGLFTILILLFVLPAFTPWLPHGAVHALHDHQAKHHGAESHGHGHEGHGHDAVSEQAVHHPIQFDAVTYFSDYLHVDLQNPEHAVLKAPLLDTQDIDYTLAAVIDPMIAIRSNFFYTRTVPCELWFLDKGKPEAMKDKVLMLDARNVFTKITRKIYDFSPEQLANLTAIFWLYRGRTDDFLGLVESYLSRTLEEALACEDTFTAAFAAQDAVLKHLSDTELTGLFTTLKTDGAAFIDKARNLNTAWNGAPKDNNGLIDFAEKLEPLAETARDLIKQLDQLYKLTERAAEDR